MKFNLFKRIFKLPFKDKKKMAETCGTNKEYVKVGKVKRK